jgi:hypothetical protein
VVKEARLVMRHLSSIRYLAVPYNTEFAGRSELNPKNYRHFMDYLQVFGEAIFPSHRTSFSTGTIVCHPDHPVHDPVDAKWFFVNGIITSPPVALLNGKELARVFQRPIHLIHTPTQGAMFDLFNSFHARTLRKDGQLSRPAFEVIKKALLEHERVVLIGHSQGTIINSYIVRKLLKDPMLRKHAHKLEVFCLAGVADSFITDPDLSREAGRPVPYVEHFANEGDFFARIGILAHRDRTEGPLFRLNRKGHLLNEHYLSSLIRGEYCGFESRMFKYINGKSPSENDYITDNREEANSSIQPCQPPSQTQSIEAISHT